MIFEQHEAIDRRECPDCGGFLFRPGPRGGAAQNMECVGCGSRFNIVILCGQWAFGHRIDNLGEWREDMFPKVLQ
jgi:hypothetical protein